MNAEQREKILEAACEVCHWPVVLNARELEDFCDRCPVERAVDAASKAEKPHGRLIDADKLRAAFPAPADWRNVNEALHHVTGIWAAIDAAETVLQAEGENRCTKN